MIWNDIFGQIFFTQGKKHFHVNGYDKIAVKEKNCFKNENIYLTFNKNV